MNVSPHLRLLVAALAFPALPLIACSSDDSPGVDDPGNDSGTAPDGARPPRDAGRTDGSPGPDASVDAGDAGTDAGPEPCTQGEIRCAGNAVQACAQDAQGSWVFGAATHCDDYQLCSDGLCEAVPDDWKPRADILREYALGVRDRTGAPGEYDFDAIATAGIDVFYEYAARAPAISEAGAPDASAPGISGFAYAFARGARAIQLSVLQGHSNLVFAGCGTPTGPAYNTQSDYGVCATTSGDAALVTFAEAGNPMGLQVGDRIVATSKVAGPNFLDELTKEPVCGSSVVSLSNRRASAAASLFAITPPGDTLQVVAPNGTTREVVIPPRSTDENAPQWYCGSMFGDYETFEVRATLRPDGIAVLRLPAFAPTAEHPFPSPLTQAAYNQWVSDYVDRLKAALDSVAGARAYIWDARSNRGGSSEVGLAIAAGTPGAERKTIIECGRRDPATMPFEFTPETSFAIPNDDRLAVTGKVAVLVDGRAYSGGDIFAYAMRNHTSARLFGTPTAGAFGYGGYATTLLGDPARMGYTADGRRCSDLDGAPLEGQGVAPHETVEPAAADLAAGRDTVLEAAVTWIGPQ